MNKLGSFCLMLLSIFLFNCSEENEEVAPITQNYIGLEVGKIKISILAQNREVRYFRGSFKHNLDATLFGEGLRVLSMC